MSYAYGTRGLPTGINQLGGLPRRRGGAAPTPAETDPYFSRVSLLLHGDGNLLDSSATNKTVTAYGNAAATNAQVRFGSGSLGFDSSGDYVTIPSVPPLGTGDFTIEMWAYLAAFNGTDYDALPCSGLSDGDTIMFGVASSGVLGVGVSATSWNVSSSSGSITTGAWSHIAIVRASGTLTIYVGGVSKGSGSLTTNFSGTGFQVNRRQVGSPVTGVECYVDELRITNGVARYTANFTPPDKAFPNA